MTIAALGSDRQSLPPMQYCSPGRPQPYPRRNSVDTFSQAHTFNTSSGRQTCVGLSTGSTGSTCQLLASSGGVELHLDQTGVGYRQSTDHCRNLGPNATSALWNPLCPHQSLYKPTSSSSRDSTLQSLNIPLIPQSTIHNYQQHQLADLQPSPEQCGRVSRSDAAGSFDNLPRASRPQGPAQSPGHQLPCVTQTVLPDGVVAPALAASVEPPSPYSTLRNESSPIPAATSAYHQPLKLTPEVLSPPAAIANLPPAHSPQSRQSDERLRVRKGSKKELTRTGVYAAAYMYQFWAHGEEQQERGPEGPDSAAVGADDGPGSAGSGDLPSPLPSAAAGAPVPNTCARSAGADPTEVVTASMASTGVDPTPGTFACDVLGRALASGGGGGKGAVVITSDRTSVVGAGAGAGARAACIAVPVMFPRTCRPSATVLPAPTFLSTGPSGNGSKCSTAAGQVETPVTLGTTAGAVANSVSREVDSPNSTSFGPTVTIGAGAPPLHSSIFAEPTGINQPRACSPVCQAGPYVSSDFTMPSTADTSTGATCETHYDRASPFETAATELGSSVDAAFAVGSHVFSPEILNAPFNPNSLSDTDLPDVTISIDLEAAPSPDFIPTDFTANTANTVAGLPYGISAATAATAENTPVGADGNAFTGAAAGSPVGLASATASLAACFVSTNPIGSCSRSHSNGQAPVLAPFPTQAPMRGHHSTAKPSSSARNDGLPICSWDSPVVGPLSETFPPVSRPPITTGAVVRTRASQHVPVPYAGGAGGPVLGSSASTAPAASRRSGNGDLKVGTSSYTAW
ncbi:hypothetical protein VaNZ11_007126 [Volvox africanus]|uniref:Uncharacterized protein n=1 Tax=Volvox africanus TaxID=51714 RepID=A0ABQ5S2I4_9CHLO|nr:hypothetical protein VaNZ11_007126 [Volvox africanus]